MSLLSLFGVSKRYGAVTALDRATLSIEPGTLTAIVGASGSGKTTLLRLIAGFEMPDEGSIMFDDLQIAGPLRVVPAHKRGIGLVAQEGALFPHLSVSGNVGFGMKSRSDHAAVDALLEAVELEPAIRTRMPHELSGGQQQRVALARALARRPKLLLLDEPFSALDASLRESVRAHVREALERSRATALIVTHDQDEALSVADTVAVLDDGLVQMHDSPEAVYRRPSGLGVARFVGHVVELPAQVIRAVASTALGPMAVDHDSDHPANGVVMLRPEQLRLLPADAVDGTPGEVVGGDYFGHDALVRVRVGSGADLVEVQVRTLGDLPGPGAVRIAVSGLARFYPSPT